jgi:hypothetical protein
MTPKAFRTMALSLPGAHEEPHFERASFRVGKKIFATLTADGTEAMVPVAPRERVLALLKEYPGVFFGHGGWTQRMGALGVKLGKVDAALLRELVVDAWSRIVPKRGRRR